MKKKSFSCIYFFKSDEKNESISCFSDHNSEVFLLFSVDPAGDSVDGWWVGRRGPLLDVSEVLVLAVGQIHARIGSSAGALVFTCVSLIHFLFVLSE